MSEAPQLALRQLMPRRTRQGNLSAWPLESQLAAELAVGMAALGVPRTRIGMVKRYVEQDWDPVPGGLDLYVASGVGSQLAIAAELKLEEVPQTMWDLYKLMAARKLTGSPETFLVTGAQDSAWRKPCGELFPERVGESRVVDTVQLFRSNRRQWVADLTYRARLQRVPTSVHVQAVAAGLRGPHYRRLEFRVTAVRPEDPTPIMCSDGWPAGTGP